VRYVTSKLDLHVLLNYLQHCPSPIDADERQLQEEEDKQYIRGRVS
jgi:hypothetical protein